jgi:glycosyltransferase involved in cell wall biosynthesis
MFNSRKDYLQARLQPCIFLFPSEAAYSLFFPIGTIKTGYQLTCIRMKIAFITRSTLYNVPGGDTVQVLQTARLLRELGVSVDICMTNNKIDYSRYDLLHFINIIRPADILFHTHKTKKPFVVSPVLVDYSEYDQQYRKGISGFILRHLSANNNEYVKTIGRWLLRKDKMRSKAYLIKGQRKSIQQILERAAMLLPNSAAEYEKLEEKYGVQKEYTIVPNGIDSVLFSPDQKTRKDDSIVLCAARIEGIKNQLNLIKALNNSRYTLLLIGSSAPNQQDYYHACRRIAAKNIQFHDHIPQETLISYYKKAKVHALPSWFETCGLSSLEAAAMGCNVAITEKGYTREYFGNDAFYCDPGDPESIYNGIETAAKTCANKKLQHKIFNQYTWQRAASITHEAYKKIIQA